MKRTVSQQQLRTKLKEKGISDDQVIQITLDRMVELVSLFHLTLLTLEE